MGICVKRHIDIKTAKYEIEVLTPMFLGGADQNGELRAAPFRNAIRTFYRVVKGEAVLEKERELFGGLDLNPGGKLTQKSKLQIQVFSEGNIELMAEKTMPALGEMHNKESPGKPAKKAAYLGLGPVAFNGSLAKKPIKPGQKFNLVVRYPKSVENDFNAAVSMFVHFGSLGARSRNGWGSFSCSPLDGTINILSSNELHDKYGKQFSTIFQSSQNIYPHALSLVGDKKLIWQLGESYASWENAMSAGAEAYMNLKHNMQIGAGGPHDRHLIGYPLMNHPATKEGRNERMPSQIHIIIRKNDGKYICFFMHLAHPISGNLRGYFDNLNRQKEVFEKMHKYLDSEKTFKRV